MQSDACKYIDLRRTGTRKYDGGRFQLIAWKKTGMEHRQLTEMTLSKTNNALPNNGVPKFKREDYFSYLWAGRMRLGSDRPVIGGGVRKTLQDLPETALRLKRISTSENDPALFISLAFEHRNNFHPQTEH